MDEIKSVPVPALPAKSAPPPDTTLHYDGQCDCQEANLRKGPRLIQSQRNLKQK